jgi:hypothetical protein
MLAGPVTANDLAAIERHAPRAGLVAAVDEYVQHVAPDPPDATPAHALLSRLTTLRYLRADAHAAAWSTRGLDAAQVGVLTALWRAAAADHDGDILEQLLRRGLVARDGARWYLTDEGRAVRDTIESDTDERAAPPWAALDPEERRRLIDSLARLPD